MDTQNSRLKLVRKKKGLNQSDFAKPLGVTAPAISKIEIGERGLTDQMILSVCREFKVCEEWLRTGEGGEENMFVPHEDSNIENLAQEYRLTELSKTILKAYVKINPPERREQIDLFMLDVARQVLGDKIATTFSKVIGEVDHTEMTKTANESLYKRIREVFDKTFPDVELHDPPLEMLDKPDALDKLRAEPEDVPLAAHDTTDTDYVRSIIDAQEETDKKHGKKGKTARSG